MSAVQAQQREQEQIVGTLSGITQKNPETWQAVVTPDGSQYTKNLWTKDQQLIVQLTSQIGNRLAFLCNVSHWNMNDGTPVRSLWIEAVGSPAMQSPAQPQAQAWAAQNQPPQTITVTPTVASMGVMTPVADDERGQKIMRQAAAKVAATLLGYLPEDQRTLSTLITLSDRLVNYFDFGTPPKANPTVEDLINTAMPQGMEGDAPLFPEGHDPGYAGDDDIPF